MKRYIFIFPGLLFSALLVVLIISQCHSTVNAGQPSPTTSPIATGTVKPQFGVRFRGVFIAGPTDGATIEWDTVPAAASYSVKGSVDWMAVRQGEGVCIPPNAPRSTAPVDASVPSGTTAFTAPLPTAALPAPLVWWPINVTIEVSAIGAQGDVVVNDSLTKPANFEQCVEAVATPTAAVQLPSTGTGPDSY